MFHNVVIVGKCAFPARVVVIVVEVESLSHEILRRLVRVMKARNFRVPDNADDVIPLHLLEILLRTFR